ncbi:MAG: hypothetical protein Q7S20_04595 [Gemmatimonadaceae bacterium]|nr:hypothetical protein [Gemmatimonadaceae bacterium]
MQLEHRDMRQLKRVAIALTLIFQSGCRGNEFTWAFAQNADGTFLGNEFCRESLAESIYAPENQGKVERQGSSNVFVFRGSIESYTVYAFRTRSECEIVLTGIKARPQP